MDTSLDDGLQDGRPPLAGLLVIDWTHVLAGPFAAYQLGLLGARIIRIEQVEGVDIIRGGSPDPQRSRLEMGDAFVMQAAGKESIAVDAREPLVNTALQKLIGQADVLVENFRPGKLAGLGFSPERLIDEHPRLIVCSLSGFGQRGPDALRPAYDHVIQAVSGLMAANADEHGRPQRIGVPLVDYATGMQAALAVLAALHRRNRDERDGRIRRRGEWLDVTMRDTALTLLTPAYASHAVSGTDRPRTRATAFSGNPLSGTFLTADGHLAVVCNTPKQSEALLSALRDAGATGSDVDALVADVAARDVDRVHARLSVLLLHRSADEWEGRLIGADVPVSRVRTPSQAYTNAIGDLHNWPRVRVPGLNDREVAVPGPGYASTAALLPPLRPPPLRGEHSRAVLRSVGLDDETIDRLCAAGAVRDSIQAESK